MKKLLLTLTLTFLSLVGYSQISDTVESKASFYHSKYHGRKTSTGEIYNETKPSAASNYYALGTKLLIINKITGQSVIVRVNDRMANYIKDRIDLSKFAFKKIAPLAKGIQKVSIVEIL